MGKELTLVSLFEGVPEGYPEELKPFLECGDCCLPRYIRDAASMDWAPSSALKGNDSFKFDLSCGCEEPSPRPDTEKWLEIDFSIGEITIREIRMRILETRPYRTFLERSRCLVSIEFNWWHILREKVANFLLLPFGFED